jgi:hypothetical protein
VFAEEELVTTRTYARTHIGIESGGEREREREREREKERETKHKLPMHLVRNGNDLVWRSRAFRDCIARTEKRITDEQGDGREKGVSLKRVEAGIGRRQYRDRHANGDSSGRRGAVNARITGRLILADCFPPRSYDETFGFSLSNAPFLLAYATTPIVHCQTLFYEFPFV